VLKTLLQVGRRRAGLSEVALREVLKREADPHVRRMLAKAVDRQMVAADDVEDLAHETMLRLVVKLRQLAGDPQCEPIVRFDDYVGTLVRHVLEDQRRSANPLRARLANRVRYVLTHTSDLATWGHDPVLCGLAVWSGRSGTTLPPVIARHPAAALEDVRAFRREVESVVRRAGAPMQLPALIAAMADAYGLARPPLVPIDGLRTAAPARPVVEALENRQYLTQLWGEIEQLPVRQRRALLLNLHLDDGDSVAHALATLGIASMRRVGEALELPLDDFLQLWEALPLPDSRIAPMLGATRQQVINLRKSARDRLARRLGRPRGLQLSGP
jgi:DNA-directed RNA polymerase specialized sigma24 family protein